MRLLAIFVLCCTVAVIVTTVVAAESPTESAVLSLIAPSTTHYSYDDPADIVLADAEGRVVLDFTTATGGVTGTTLTVRCCEGRGERVVSRFA